VLFLVALPVVVFVLPGSSSSGNDVAVEVSLLVFDQLRKGGHNCLQKVRLVLIEGEIDAIVVIPARKGMMLLHGKGDTCNCVRTVSSSLKMP
jgi:hypothetical protein